MTPLPLADTFEARYWMVPEFRGVDAFSPYAECFWMPLLAPTTFLLARRMLMEPCTWEKPVLAAAVGVGYRGGTKDILERSLDRLVGFKLAAVETPPGADVGNVLYVRPKWPRLSRKAVGRLPQFLQEEEEEAWKREQRP